MSNYYDALIAKWKELGGETAEKLAAINALTVEGVRSPVDIATAMGYLRRNNLWLAIKARAALSESDPNFSVGAVAAVDLNADTRISTIDFTLPIVGAMLSDLVNKKLLSQDHAAALAVLGATTVPWWQSVGYSSPIGTGDLEAAGLS